MSHHRIRLAFRGKRIYNTIRHYRYLFLLLLLFLFFTGRVIGGRHAEQDIRPKQDIRPAALAGDEGSKGKIVLDAGHGGVDPGKVSKNGIKEKDINLQIVKRLQSVLEESGYTVVLTRSEDISLHQEGSTNKKRDDMMERVRRIEEEAPTLVISIHQNSYPKESCKGAQVFYYKSSTQGATLASELQKAFPEVLQDGNRRQAKANSDYYLLRKVSCPIVIVECGFLSNPEEESLLQSEDYQKRLTEAILLGLESYEKMQ